MVGTFRKKEDNVRSLFDEGDDVMMVAEDAIDPFDSLEISEEEKRLNDTLEKYGLSGSYRSGR